MGCDIHWLLERKDQDGAWHAVASKDRFYALRTGGYEQNRHQAEYRIGRRDYGLFGLLSGVRSATLGRGALMTRDLPEAPSEAALCDQERLGSDAHDWGWASGKAIIAWRDLGYETITRWIDDLDAFMSAGPIDEVLPDRVIRDWERTFADLAGTESGHEAMARQEKSASLLDWRADPTAWRLVVYYDN